MFDKLVRYGAMTDWITPVSSMIRGRLNGPSVRYNIWVQSGWSALAIQQILRDGGVRIWGLTIYGDIIAFRARAAQARYAQYLMDRADIPYVGGINASSTARTSHRKSKNRRSRRQTSSRRSLADQLYSILR